ncbi:hypothetical protein MP638_005339 [Amoeboaphelidium occidentale]|nr:hypothetical protein MP638_005339 [Amoeboaphelidium occidentale]
MFGRSQSRRIIACWLTQKSAQGPDCKHLVIDGKVYRVNQSTIAAYIAPNHLTHPFSLSLTTTNNSERIYLKFHSTWPIEIDETSLPERCQTVAGLKKVVKEAFPLKLDGYGEVDFSLFSPDGEKLEEDLLLNRLPETSSREPLRVVIRGRFTGLKSFLEFANVAFAWSDSSSLSSRRSSVTSSLYNSASVNSSIPSSSEPSPEESAASSPLYLQNTPTKSNNQLKSLSSDVRRRKPGNA